MLIQFIIIVDRIDVIFTLQVGVIFTRFIIVTKGAYILLVTEPLLAHPLLTEHAIHELVDPHLGKQLSRL